MPATTSNTAPQKQAPMEMGARDGIVVAQPVSCSSLNFYQSYTS
jgi:hypothetical protein